MGRRGTKWRLPLRWSEHFAVALKPKKKTVGLLTTMLFSQRKWKMEIANEREKVAGAGDMIEEDREGGWMAKGYPHKNQPIWQAALVRNNISAVYRLLCEGKSNLFHWTKSCVKNIRRTDVHVTCGDRHASEYIHASERTHYICARGPTWIKN